MIKFAAIDIGSNAIRLLIMDVNHDEYPVKYTKNTLLRIPLRLGEDVFESGKISKEKKDKLLWALLSFKYLCKVHDVVDTVACATSAMREAQNGNQVIQEIEEQTELKIELISGRREAEIIHSYKFEDLGIKSSQNAYLYVDVGGGSTEISLFHLGKILHSNSFKIGTVRMLKNKVEAQEWENMNQWVQEISKPYKDVHIIGSGGNINKVIKLINQKRNDSNISLSKLNKLYKELEKLTYNERIKKYNLNPDRADVIVPALKIFTQIMQKSHAQNVIVPRIGLADGLIKILYESYAKKYALLNFS